MFKEILKIIPRLETKDLHGMERTLNQRFARVARRFGQGMRRAMMGGGIFGAALSLINRILNPLQEVQASIDRMLKSSDDLVTNAAQFNTTAGKLFKLQQLGTATGLDSDSVFDLLRRFQVKVAEAQADPTKQTSVRNFADREDTADAFFEFIQQLQKMNKNDQVLVQREVFGDRQILKMADFLQQDFPALLKKTGLGDMSSDKFSTALEKAAGLNDLQDALTAKREADDLLAKSRQINEGMIRGRDETERLKLSQERERIRSYQDLRTISDTSTQIMGLVEKGVAMLGSLISTLTPLFQRLVSAIEKLGDSRLFRGIFGGK
jgi:hypothetical protein